MCDREPENPIGVTIMVEISCQTLEKNSLLLFLVCPQNLAVTLRIVTGSCERNCNLNYCFLDNQLE